MTIVRVEDMRALNYCARGSRTFAQLHGLDWARFVSEGLPADELARLNDMQANAAIEKAKEREARENGIG